MVASEELIEDKKKKNAVLIVAYTDTPSLCELASFEQCIKILGNHPIVMLCPCSLDGIKYMEIAEKYEVRLKFVSFEDAYFVSVKSYNRLMLSIEFYKNFLEYECILMYQLDAWVFKDELDYWCNRGFDYIGAPWFEGFDTCDETSPLLPVAGNGGFSLRRVHSVIQLLSLRTPSKPLLPTSATDASKSRPRMPTVMSFFMKTKFNEDRLFAAFSSNFTDNFKVATAQESIAFSFEANPRVLYEMNNCTLPFGCHAFKKYDWAFWQDKILF